MSRILTLASASLVAAALLSIAHAQETSGAHQLMAPKEHTAFRLNRPLLVNPSHAHHLQAPVSFPRRYKLTSTTAAVAPAPIRAATFIGSIGVNTHFDWGGPWTQARVSAEMTLLGINNIRDGALKGRDDVVAIMAALAKQGIKFDIEQTINSGVVDTADDMTEMAKLIALAPGSIAFYEGANEYNANSYTLGSASSNNNLAWGALDDQASQTALKGNAALASIPLIAASTANVNTAPSIAGYADRSNWHVYSGIGTQLAANLAGAIAAAQVTLPGKPVAITETGISSASVTGQTWGTAGDEYTQGLIDTNALLDSFNDGAVATYLYSLMDNQAAADLEDNFGLFNVDGTAKAAATDIHNLTTILADSSATAGTFTVSAPAFVLPTLPAGASSMLLQKASGVWDLVLWNSGATVWSGAAEVTPTPVAVTMPLAGTYTSVKVYDPLTGTAPTQTLANTSSVSLSLGKEPQVIEIAGLVPSVVPVVTTGCAAAATDTLRITTSEDAYNGDAQFTVSVDGKQVGGTYTATASHTAGKTADLILTGTWGSGSHVVGISFLNDAYGGSATTDMNLYVSAVKYDGVPSTGAAQELPWDMTATWTVGQ